MSLITQTAIYRAFINQARSLLDGSDIVHPEYVRGMVELTMELNGLTSDDKEQIEQDILEDLPVLVMDWVPVVGQRVRTKEMVVARDVGADTMTTVYSGCRGTIAGVMPEFGQIHFIVDTSAFPDAPSIEVWLDPSNVVPQ